MKIVVIGGSGLIGSKLVKKLSEDGHDPLAASPDSGVDTLTGEGLAEGLEGAEVVVDVSNAPVWDDATQFYEFIGRIPDSSTDGNTVYLPPVLIQPEAADDVAAALADAAASAPVNGTVELAGPERFRLDELTRCVLSANNAPRRVTADRHARYFGAELDDHSLTPGANRRASRTGSADPRPGTRTPMCPNRKEALLTRR
jgi:uncharacterized protein YbjT (DUF2867 family)